MLDPTPARHPALLVLSAGLIVGALDISYACLYWGLKAGTPARRVFQSVAAGVLGKASFAGGTATAALGLALHFFIATAMAVTYYLVAQRWTLLVRRPVLCGAAYGALLYAVMTYVVVPLSAAGGGGGKRDVLWITLSLLVHIALIGIPIGVLSGRAAVGFDSASADS